MIFLFQCRLNLLLLFIAETPGTDSENTAFVTSGDLSVASLSQIELSEADDRMKRFYGVSLFELPLDLQLIIKLHIFSNTSFLFCNLKN